MNRHARLLPASLLLFGAMGSAQAGTFLASESLPDRVMHPAKTELGGSVTLNVCLDPAQLPTVTGDPQTDSPDQAIRNALARFNAMQPVTGNVLGAAGQGVTGGSFDFESVMMHELGHCVGLDHNVIGPSEAACSITSTCSTSTSIFATMSNEGNNGNFDVLAGVDGMRASRDDLRGDDANRHWFRKNINNPFETPPATVDRQTYSVATGSFLPIGHTYAEASTHHSPCSNPSSSTSSLPGRVANTQNATFPVLCGNNVIRQLAPDDVATLRIARAGRDGTQGNADDYTLNLQYAGRTSTGCDLIVRFEEGVGFGLCNLAFSSLGDNATILSFSQNSGSGRLRFEKSVNWFFNQNDTTTPASADLSISKTIDKNPAPVGEPLVYTVSASNAGPSTATSVSVVDTLPNGVTFSSASGSGWGCVFNSGAVTCTRASLGVGSAPTISITVNLPSNYAGSSTLTNLVAISSAVSDSATGNNSFQLQTTVDFLAQERIFKDGFEAP